MGRNMVSGLRTTPRSEAFTSLMRTVLQHQCLSGQKPQYLMRPRHMLRLSTLQNIRTRLCQRLSQGLGAEITDQLFD